MEVMDVVDELHDLLQLNINRDKVLNLFSYGLKFIGSSTQKQHILNASAKLANARACLRMYDDAFAIKNIVNYGFGKQEGTTWGAIGVAGGIFTLGYLQAEKLQFLIDTGILKVSKETEFKIRTAHKLIWSLYAFVGFVRSLRALHLSAKVSKSPNHSKCAQVRFTQAALTSTKLLLDVVHAVSWLPPGWLWGNALSNTQASGIATAAAVMGLVVYYHGKKLK